jgi:uncharacterized protein YcfJ
MNKVLTLTAVFALASSALSAAELRGTVVKMQETYRDVVSSTPVESCKTVEVPIYEERRTGGGNAGEGALGGMIIGGVLGKVIGGNDKGAAAGAILGGIVGADKAQGTTQTVIVGYRNQRQCTTVYQDKARSVRGDNIVTVRVGNQTVTFNTQQWYRKGTTVYLNASL